MNYVISERQFNLLYEQVPGIERTPAATDNAYVKEKPTFLSKDIVMNQRCGSQYNQKTLSAAVKWWEDWLKSPVTLKKFSDNWGITTQEASQIFKKYSDFLKKLKLVYVFEPNEILAYVKTNRYERLTSNPNNIIYVNCYIENEDSYSTLVHEIQHLLFAIKPLHPEQKINSDSRYDIKIDVNNKESIWRSIYSLFGGSKQATLKNQSNIQSSLNKDGIKDSKWWVNSFNRNISRDKDYVENKNEILSRLTQIRSKLKIKPGQDIPLKSFVELVNEGDSDVYWIMMDIINRGISIREMLKELNSYAKNNTKLPIDPSKNNEYKV